MELELEQQVPLVSLRAEGVNYRIDGDRPPKKGNTGGYLGCMLRFSSASAKSSTSSMSDASMPTSTFDSSTKSSASLADSSALSGLSVISSITRVPYPYSSAN